MRSGSAFERVVAHHRPASPDRQSDEEGSQIRIGGTYAVVGPKVLARLFESQTITTHQPFQLYRNGAKALRLRRRPPLPPHVVPVIEIDPLNDDREVGAQAAPLLELPEDLVVLVHQPDFDL